MADLNIMPVFTDAYLADTTHLSREQHGSYMLLLLAMWRAGGRLKNDPEFLMRVAKCGEKAWPKTWAVLEPLLQVDADFVSQKRLASEYARAEAKVKLNRENASKGGKAKALNNNKMPLANANRTLGENSSDTPAESCPTVNRKPLTDISSAQSRAKPSEEFEKFWSVYPKRDGSNPKHPAEKKFIAAVKSGVDPADIIGGAERYRAQLRAKGKEGTEFVKQAQFWLSNRSWQDYPAPNAGKPLDDESWRTRLNLHYRDGIWNDSWGDPPSTGRCKAPAHILAEFDPQRMLAS